MKSSNALSSPKTESRALREQRRAQRQAAYEHYTDSLVLSHNFSFKPFTMQGGFAAPPINLANPNFELTIWDNAADIYLPYLRGLTPPQQRILLNYTITQLDGYTTEQIEQGWHISFKSNLYSTMDYTFTLEVDSRYGSTTLTISNPWYDTVQYSGTLSPM